ncbi:DUF1015 family protein [Kineococcus aurantiacus]|uniref:Uncharacterized protein (DUF1015 family) n=1 Tax=Kineococcus aurantiacus TaxID=37633 RepID=A0A7Y9AS24_9ACTN|nr:uncharacterized protein (DUF1015 family) [Kineococcus aurantiacus]
MEDLRTGTRAVPGSPVGTSSPSGPLLHPFGGLRYAQRVTGPLWRLLAPPHTEIDKARRADLLASSPYVVTHLERPEYGHDTRQREVNRWLEAGALEQDAPGLYVVRQHGTTGTRHFLVGALEVLPHDPRVRPHEGVFEQAVDARLERLERTGVDSEPVLLVDSDPWPLEWRHPEHVGQLLSSAFDQDGNPLLEVWQLRDPDVVRALARASAKHRFLIADGHHRHAAVQRSAVRRGRAERLLVAVADDTTEPVDLQPLHRVLPREAAERVVERAHHRRPVLLTTVEDIARVAGGLPPDQALVLLPDRAVVVEGAPTTGPAVGSGAWVDDAVRAGGTAAEDVRYLRELSEVRAAVGDRAAILLPRTDLAALQVLVREGRLLGRKTTSFRPKPLAGAVLRLR